VGLDVENEAVGLREEKIFELGL